ncbi:hypothetical protein BDV37DRAFT_29944 [Aspergillus pseudonomiae]|uniref:Uncharacterized protein n=1 Tax=Aspergillus pseudonomiae TaxID=1506151 RepID=A0A5N7DLE9_9EURO|nr:uncharacterized protein BDV37DRAFT_29944 [Aspergillus pseudonomiae]KAE8407260.1 hypothetical protein BDV37DRAFT_29944 [Aspergillus pseudonomiae]
MATVPSHSAGLSSFLFQVKATRAYSSYGWTVLEDAALCCLACVCNHKSGVSVLVVPRCQGTGTPFGTSSWLSGGMLGEHSKDGSS